MNLTYSPATAAGRRELADHYDADAATWDDRGSASTATALRHAARRLRREADAIDGTPAPLDALTLCNACEAEQANPRCPAGYCNDEGCGCPNHS